MSATEGFSLLKKRSLAKKKDSAVISQSPPSDTVTDVNDGNQDFRIDQATLTELVKKKDVAELGKFGSIHGVASAIQTNLKDGICGGAGDINLRRAAFGTNAYKRPPTKGFFRCVVEAFMDLTYGLLLVCAALSLAFAIEDDGLQEALFDGGSICVIVFLGIPVSALSKYMNNRQLSKVSDNILIDVIRNGLPEQVPILDVVRDVCLEIGDQLPADGLFIDDEDSLRIDESSMTAQSDHEKINRNQNPFLFSGTRVARGRGRMLVTSVGMNNTSGETMSHNSGDTSEEIPFQKRLDKLSSSVDKARLGAVFFAVVVLLIRYFTGNTKDEEGNREFNGSETEAGDIVNAVVSIVADAVTIAVVATPAAFPLAVNGPFNGSKTIVNVVGIVAGTVSIILARVLEKGGLLLAATLTFLDSMKEMIADQAMRKFSMYMTMGSATTICIDKTGTLTMNPMEVTKFWLGRKAIEQSTSSASPRVLELIKEGIALNTTGSVCQPNPDSEFEFSGSPTEKAIHSWAVRELNMNMDELKHNFTILKVEAFNPKKKRSGVLMRKKLDNTIHVHWKGATEMILAMCSSYYDASGKMKDMGDMEKQHFEQIIKDMAAGSLLCIAIAHKQLSEKEYEDEEKMLKEDSLTLLGLVGIKDPYQPGMKKAVEVCQNAGVNVKMITGDNIFTATSTAVEWGILETGENISSEAVVEGEEFRNYTPQQRMEKVDQICVMARSSPLDKLLMVECLKQKEQVVAVTGDGTNDAPAFKAADIRLSMGTQGTEVAEESSDIIILDDNFAFVATVLKWGRCVYNNIQEFFQESSDIIILDDNFASVATVLKWSRCAYSNIQKLIQFQLTGNVVYLGVNLVAIVSGREFPLSIVQLIWVDLILDMLGALALADEQPTNDLMEKPPVGRTEPLTTNIMWRNLLAQAFYQMAMLLTLQFKGESIFGVTEAVNDTLIFDTLVLCQVFNEFNARKLEKKNIFEGVLKGKLFMGIIGMTIVVQVLMVEILENFAGTKRLKWSQWGACIGIAALSWPIGWSVKSIPVPERPIFSYLSHLKWKRPSWKAINDFIDHVVDHVSDIKCIQ